MNIAICEDYAADLILLREFIERYMKSNSYQGDIRTFTTAEELLAVYASGAFDLIFLDIYLPGISGMDAARKIREQDMGCQFVFITVSPDFALNGFQVGARGYVTKPIDPKELETALQSCHETFERMGRVIAVPQLGETIELLLSKVEYIEVYDNHSLFHMHGCVVETRLPLDEIEEKLGGEPFLRCHRSYIVNMNDVQSIRADDFLMKCGAVVPIRKNGRKEVRLAFTRFKAISGMEAVRV